MVIMATKSVMQLTDVMCVNPRNCQKLYSNCSEGFFARCATKDLQAYSTVFYLQVHLTLLHTISTLKSLLLCEDAKSSVTLLLKTKNKCHLQGSQCLRRSDLGVVEKSLKRYTSSMVLMWLRNGLSTSDGTEGTDTAVTLRNCIQDEFNSAFNRTANYPHKSRIQTQRL
jgi:hypothetical protein